MKSNIKFAAAAVVMAAAQWAAAAPLNFAGALTANDPVYNRPLSGNPPTLLSAFGSAVSYDTYQFFVDTSGSYTMETLAAAFTTADADDTFITLYLGSTFNSATPLVGALQADDDSGVGLLSLISRALVANTNYLLVVTSFTNGQFGNYNGTIRANGAGNVIGGTVPTGVPAPATAALVPLALAALALTRRRRPAEAAA